MHSNFYMIGIDSCCSWAQKLFKIYKSFQNKGEVLYRNLPRVWHNLSFLVHERSPEVEKNIWQVENIWQVKIWQVEKDIWHGFEQLWYLDLSWIYTRITIFDIQSLHEICRDCHGIFFLV